jgi:catechol 2,3-dioxygenase-like lactoylglutathione lyase family enzyme
MTAAAETAKAQTVDMKLEVVVIPVSDVDRAKRFYGGLGWRLDADFTAPDGFRVIQFTPPGSPCSIHFGTARPGVGSAVPGSAQGLYLVVRDVDGARAELAGRGVEVSEVFHRAGREGRFRGPDPERRSYSSLATFKDRTAMAGCCRRSPRACPDGWTRPAPPSPRRPNSPPRCDAPQPRMASTKSGPAGTTTTGRTGTPTTWSRRRPASSCRHRQPLKQRAAPFGDFAAEGYLRNFAQGGLAPKAMPGNKAGQDELMARRNFVGRFFGQTLKCSPSSASLEGCKRAQAAILRDAAQARGSSG